MTDVPGAIQDKPGPEEWQDADLVSALIALDPVGLGGVTLQASAGPARDRWIDILKTRFEAVGPVRRVPAGVSEDRLIGGIDLAATLAAGYPVTESGLLVQSDRGALLVPMAERMERRAAAHMAAALDMCLRETSTSRS